MLRPGALLLVVVWGGRDSEGPFDHEWLDPPRYFNIYTDEQMTELPTPGFRRVSFEALTEVRSGELHPQVSVLEAE